MKYLGILMMFLNSFLWLSAQEKVLELDRYVLRQDTEMESYFSDIVKTSGYKKYLIAVIHKPDKFILDIKGADQGIPEYHIDRVAGIIHYKNRVFYLTKPYWEKDISLWKTIMNKYFSLTGKEKVREKIFFDNSLVLSDETKPSKETKASGYRQYQIIILQKTKVDKDKERKITVTALLVSATEAKAFSFY